MSTLGYAVELLKNKIVELDSLIIGYEDDKEGLQEQLMLADRNIATLQKRREELRELFKRVGEL